MADRFLSETTKTVARLACSQFFCLRLLLVIGMSIPSSGCQSGASADATLLRIREEMGRGQLDGALRDVNAALLRYKNENPQWGARFLVEKAHVLMLRGSYSESLQLLSESPPPSLRQSEVEVERKMVQGVVYSYLQQFELSDRALSEAEAIASQIHSSLLGDVAQARGILEMDRKNYAKAAEAYRAAAAFAKEHNLARAELNALGSLGNVAMLQEHYDEALDRFKTALDRSRLLAVPRAEANALGNLGWTYSVVGDFENAEDFLKGAERKSLLAGLLNDRTYWLNSLAEVYFRQGRYVEAQFEEEEALALARRQDDKGTLTECLNTLSEIALATGHVELAENYNREALRIEQAGLDQFGIASSTIIAGRIAAAEKEYKEAGRTFQTIIGDRAVQTALRWEAEASLAQVHAAQGNAALAAREFGESIRTITRARDGIQNEEFRLSFLSSAIRFYDAYVNFLIEQKRRLDALKIADKSRAQTLEQGLSLGTKGKARQSRASHPEEIARRLNATLLFYWLGEERSHLWVITAKGISLFSLPGRAEIDATVKSYLDSFTLPRDPLEAGNADAKKLYATLVQPAEKLIPKNSRVILLPDRGLYSLNFETLIVPGPKPHYWIEDVTLTTASSLSLLSRTSLSPPAKTTSLFLMGDALSASPDFPPLPQASKEVGLVQNYFPKDGRTVLTAAQATASHFLSGKPETSSYLHFASHGTASTAHPLESAVILSPDGDSYKLYARDVVQHPLRAYLVTISACNGSGLRTYAGEGLVGLAWAFLRAGAHNVIAGLWEVSNASTPQLMDELYKGLNAGKDPASALRDAKLTLVHATGNYKRPFYWAPFQLYAGS